MIHTITYAFPKSTTESQEFFRYLSLLLKELPNNDSSDEGIVLTASAPSACLPATTFEQKDIAFPEMHFDADPEFQLTMGNFSINGNSVAQPPRHKTPTVLRLTIKELYEKLQKHIVRIDHTGINIPTALVSKEQWQIFVKRVASQSNLYNYPTGEPWLFILPATEAECNTDITDFPAGREPKCELVYDNNSKIPTIQIDIETDLTRKEVEALFPSPYGVSFPELADYFRTVYLQHEWVGLDIRFDLRFKSDKPGPWETGKWLAEDGGRIH
jgi:hypothetical protein